MYAGCPGRNVHGLARLGPQDLACRGVELREHQGRGGWSGRLEMLARGSERPAQRCGEREAPEPSLERLQPAAVVLARDGARRQERLRRAHHETTRSTAATTSVAGISARQRWWPSGQAAVPVAEQGRQSRVRSSTTERAR